MAMVKLHKTLFLDLDKRRKEMGVEKAPKLLSAAAFF